MARRSVQPDTHKLDALRISRGWNVDTFAGRVGLTKRGLEYIMAGNRMLVSTAARIAERLKVPVESFLIGTTPAPTSAERRFDVHVRLAIDFEEFDEAIEGLALAESLNGEAIRAESKGPGKTTVTIEMTASTIRSLASHFPQLNINPDGLLALLQGVVSGNAVEVCSIDRKSILNFVELIEFPDTDEFPCPEWRGKTFKHRTSYTIRLYDAEP